MKRVLGVVIAFVLIAAVAIVAVFVAGNKASQPVVATETHIDDQAEADAAAIVAAAEADAASILAQAEADAASIRAQTAEETFSFEEEEITEVQVPAYERVNVDGQQVFIGSEDAIVEYLSDLTRQDWLELATINRCFAPFYARVLPWQAEVVRDGAFVSAYRMTTDQCEYSILRNAALLVQDAQGQVVVDNSTIKVSGVNDRDYPRAAYAAEAEALYEGKTLAASYTRVNAMGTLKVSNGFDTQEIFRALVLAEGDFVDEGGNIVHGYFVAWRIVEGPCGHVVNNPPHNPDPTVPPTTNPTAQPTANPTSEPTQAPTQKPTEVPTTTPAPAHSTPEPDEHPAHSTPNPDGTTPAHSDTDGNPSHTEPTGDFKDSNENPNEVMGGDREPATPDNGVPAHTEPTGDFVDSSESVHEVMDQSPRHAPVADNSQQVSSSTSEIDVGYEARHSATVDSTTCVVVDQQTVVVEHSAPADSEDDFSASDELSAFWN